MKQLDLFKPTGPSMVEIKRRANEKRLGVVKMREEEGMTFRAIGERLGIGPESARQKYLAGLRYLKRRRP